MVYASNTSTGRLWQVMVDWQEKFKQLLKQYLVEEQNLDVKEVVNIYSGGYVSGCDTCSNGSGYRDIVAYQDSNEKYCRYQFEEGFAHFLGWIT